MRSGQGWVALGEAPHACTEFRQKGLNYRRIEVDMMVYANRNDVRRIHDRYSETERQDKQRASDPLESIDHPSRQELVSTQRPNKNFVQTFKQSASPKLVYHVGVLPENAHFRRY
jgi:hypothetical protein